MTGWKSKKKGAAVVVLGLLALYLVPYLVVRFQSPYNPFYPGMLNFGMTDRESTYYLTKATTAERTALEAKKERRKHVYAPLRWIDIKLSEAYYHWRYGHGPYP